MNKDEAVNAPARQVGNGGQDEHVLDWGTPPANNEELARLGREAFARAEAAALADPVKARQTMAGTFALARAIIDQRLQANAATANQATSVTPSDEQIRLEAQTMKRVTDTAEGMMAAPFGAVPRDDTMKLVVTEDLKALDAIQTPELRQRALQVAAESRIAQPAYDEEFRAQAKPELLAEMGTAVVAREVELANEEAVDQAYRDGIPKVENTIQPAPAVTLQAGEPTPDEKTRLSIITSTEHLLVNLPIDDITVEEAAGHVQDDVAALSGIRDHATRERALTAIAESAEAQPRYKVELETQAPAVAAQAEARALSVRSAAPEVENTIEPAPALMLGEGHKHPATVEDDDVYVPELDADALNAVAAKRARDREIVRRQFGWNTIEPAAVAEHKPAIQTSGQPAPAATVPAAPEAVSLVVPEEVERAYLHVGNRFYMPTNHKRVAFEDHGDKLKSAITDVQVTLSMVKIAEARGWTSIKVDGTPEFCREAWRQASLLGMKVDGYKPTELDLADLARRAPKKAENQVAGTATTPAAQAPGTAPGVYVSPEDFALLTTLKAAGWGKAQPPSPALSTAAPAPAVAAAPATPALKGDKLVEHGPAPYQHVKDNPKSYYAVLENAQGVQRTVWGVKLGEAIDKAGVKVGDRISLYKNGKEQVTVDAKVKNEAGEVVGTRKIGATRNEWEVKAHTFATQSPVEGVQQHRDLAGAYGTMAALTRQAHVDYSSPQARAIIAARQQENIGKAIARGELPKQDLKEKVESKRGTQQEAMQ